MMETIPCQASPYFPSSSNLQSSRVNGRWGYFRAMSRNLQDRFSKLNVKLKRREVLEFIGYNSVLLGANSGFAAPMMPDMNDPEVIRTFKLGSGVKIQDIIEGDGRKAREGDLVEVNYVCRRANGYFVHSTVNQFTGETVPVVLPLDEKQIIKGLKQVLVGMKVGGKRRALIPPSVGYTTEKLKPVPDEFGPRRSLFSHANEPLIFEVQLLKIL